MTIDTYRKMRLQDLLQERAHSPDPGSLFIYSLGKTSGEPEIISYKRLYDQARECSRILATLPSFTKGGTVFLHLDDHWDNILWFWAVLFAECIPVLSPPLSNLETQRRDYLAGLSKLFGSSIGVVQASSLPKFENINHSLNLHTVKSLLELGLADCNDKISAHTNGGFTNRDVNGGTGLHTQDESSLAVLMLTSGTTGNAKAVRLTHKQILASIRGKVCIRELPPSGAFLNWIGLDHVAGLTEIHIQALWLGVDQVHVHAADVLASPPIYLDLLSRHRISRSFAPNFFLAKLVAAVPLDGTALPPWDLSMLVSIISGGETNDVSTCVAVTNLLQKLGARRNVIIVGFGMTETCAGSIYNTECPEYDITSGQVMASMGRCIPGIETRIMSNEHEELAATAEIGSLDIRGPIVFDGYYHNPLASNAAFTSDGWFRTGDQAFIDSNGFLHLVGRLKDVFNINGVKIATADVQASVEGALRNSKVARVNCFPSRAPGAPTDRVTVAYYAPSLCNNMDALADIDSLVVEACMMVNTACFPHVFSITPDTFPLIPISTLGKISPVKMRALLESGAFDNDMKLHQDRNAKYKRLKYGASSDNTFITESEALLRSDFAQTLGIEDVDVIDVDTTLFELGFASMDLVRLKVIIDSRLGFTVDIVLLLKHPTVRTLASALERLSNDPEDLNGESKADGHKAAPIPTTEVADANYNPVVVLRSRGSKTPIWLLHPGIGEILVFVGLAKYMRDDDRPIYALRARGLEPGQSNFTSIDEIVDIYVEAIRHKQPNGPYALAGYSYGSMLAFEIAKRLQSIPGCEIKFLGSLNLPPHIRERMRQLQWNMCLLHLAQFLDLVSEDYADSITLEDDANYRELSREEAMDTIIKLAGAEKMRELGMERQDLLRWTNTAHALPSVALEFEPSGCVQNIDVFHAEPLKILRVTRQQWVTERLSLWKDFCETEPRFHEVRGTHYSMIGPDHVASFARQLKMALKGRGI